MVAPESPIVTYVFGHGAGAGMRHSFMETVAGIFADHGVATVRYNFPYMEAGKRAPNSRAILTSTVRSAVASAREMVPEIPIIAGGKSMGGRMTSLAMSEQPMPDIVGLVFFGFPLHAAGRPGTDRADHLQKLSVPMLFLQGSRDRLADLKLMENVVNGLRPTAEISVVEDGDHSLKVPARSGRSHDDVLRDVVSHASRWAKKIADAEKETRRQ